MCKIHNFGVGSLRLADLEAGGKDKTEFIKWREEMALQDAALERATLERKHLVSGYRLNTLFYIIM